MTDLPRNDELVLAAGAGDLETVKRLIESGADPNSEEKHGIGSLLNFDPEVTRYLLEHGADPDLQRNENREPVIVGVCGHFECLRLMVEAGANVNRAGEHNGETALHGVAGGSDTRAVRLLLEYGANPNARTKPGMTTFGLWRDARVRGESPLHRAAAWGSPEVIQLLLDAGADPTIRDANKDTPLSWASWYRRDKSIIDQLSYEGSGIGPDFPPGECGTLEVSESSGQSTTRTPPSGIVACYKAEDNAHDAVGSNHATAHATTYGPGKVGRAFQFDGEGYVRVPDAPSLNSAAITVAAWVKSPGEGITAQGAYRYLVAKGINSVEAASYALFTGRSGGGLCFYVYDGHDAALSPDAGAGIWDGKWHHVAGTFDGTSVRLYADGRQVGYGTPATLNINYNLPDTNDLFIGTYLWPGGSLGFTGSIDELSIYNRALSASEIQTIYSAGNAGNSNESAPAT